MTVENIDYTINNQVDLNLSYMPFIKNGGLFIPTEKSFPLGTKIIVHLQLPGTNEKKAVEGKVVWITPENALYENFSGIGIQFVGDNAKAIHEQIKANLDTTMDVGGYTYGMTMEISKPKPKGK